MCVQGSLLYSFTLTGEFPRGWQAAARQILTADPADNSNRNVVEVLIALEN